MKPKDSVQRFVVERAWLETVIPPVFGKGRKTRPDRRSTPNTVVGLFII
jgi:hypothetical protein